MTDLNKLIPANSGLYLLLADSINSSGGIVGLGVTRNGDLHGFLATPTHGKAGRDSAAPAAEGGTGEGEPVPLTENVRQLLPLRPPAGRFAARLPEPR